MADWHAEIPVSAVVALVPRRQEGAPPPAELPVPPRPPRATRLLLVLLGALGALSCFGGVVLLWLSDSPGIAFDLVFTVMGAVMGLGLLALVSGWHTTAAEEEQAVRQWRQRPPGLPCAGVVVDREVSLGSESGHVVEFHLLIRLGDEQVAASWKKRGRQALLQTQVPGVGSTVRVWRSSAGPVLVEAVDPSVVEPRDAH